MIGLHKMTSNKPVDLSENATYTVTIHSITPTPTGATIAYTMDRQNARTFEALVENRVWNASDRAYIQNRITQMGWWSCLLNGGQLMRGRIGQ